MIDHDTARSLVLMLDNAIPYFDKAAEHEARAEAGKTMRCITKRETARCAKKLLLKAATELDMLSVIS